MTRTITPTQVLGLTTLTAITAWLPLQTQAGPPFTVSGSAGGNPAAPAIASDAGGNAIVVWQAPDGDGNGIFGRRFAADGSPLGATFPVNTSIVGDQQSPLVRTDASGRYVVSFATVASDGRTSVHVRRYSAAGVAIDIAPIRLPLDVQVHSLALAADGTATFAGIHQDFTTPVYGPATVRVRRFSFDGNAVGSEANLGDASGFSGPPGVCAHADGRYAVAFRRVDSGNDAVLERFGSNGQSLGKTVFGNLRSEGRGLKLACLRDGGYVASYTRSSVGELAGEDILVQRFDAGGAVAGSEFQANDQSSNGNTADLVADPDGGFGLVWSNFVVLSGDSDNPETYVTHVLGRRYGATGMPLTPITRLDSPVAPRLSDFAAVTRNNRNIAVTWMEGIGTGYKRLDAVEIIARQLP